MAMVRDTAVQKLRDLTIAVALAAAAAVALIAWVSAATIPGTANASGQTGNAANGGQPVAQNNDGAFSSDDGINPGRPARNGNGPGIVVSGGSH